MDQHGRVVILHGLNLVWKRKPYAPPATAAGFTERDAAFFRKYGFNAGRIGMLWAGVTPTAKGVADASYFRRWDRVIKLLADRGIWTLFDGHQDMWHEQYGGEGAPAWAARRPSPFNLTPYVKVPFPMGYWTPEVSTVFDDFWANKDGLLDGWAAYWKLVAQRYRNQPYNAGYDLMNEPWAGLEWPTCLLGGCPSTYENELQPAYTKGLRAVRSADPNNLVWWEPQQFAGGQKLDTFFTAVAGERNLGLSWHNYCPDVFFESQGLPGGNVENCPAFSTDRNQHALEQAREMRAAPLMTEFGATDNVKAVGYDAAVADRHAMGWTYWAYKHWNDPTTADAAQGLFTDDADLSTIKRAKLRKLVRTYPQAIQGTPISYRYDDATGHFRLAFNPKLSISKPTVIFVSPLTARKGYRVELRNARLVAKQGSRVYVRARTSAPAYVTITPLR